MKKQTLLLFISTLFTFCNNGITQSQTLFLGEKISYSYSQVTDISNIRYLDYSSLKILFKSSYQTQIEAEKGGYINPDDVMSSYMSASTSEWHHSLFFDDFPEFNIAAHGHGRLDNERLEVIFSFSFDYLGIPHFIYKVNEYDYNNVNLGVKLFLLEKRDNRWGIITEFKNVLLSDLFSLLKRVKTSVIASVFFTESYLLKKPNIKFSEAVEELIKCSQSSQLDGVNLTKLLFLLEKWKKENQVNKLKEVYNDEY